MPDIVMTGAFVAVTMPLAAVVAKSYVQSRRATVDPATGRMTLRFTRLFSAACLCLAACVLAAGAYALATRPRPIDLTRAATEAAGFTGMVFLTLVLPASLSGRRRTHLDETGLTSESAFGRPTVIRWRDVVEIGHNRVDLKIHGRGRLTVTISAHYNGTHDAIPALARWLPRDVYDADYDTLQWFARSVGDRTMLPRARPVARHRR